MSDSRLRSRPGSVNRDESGEHVRAQPVAERRRPALYLRLRERFQNTFWLLPALFLVGAFLLAVITRAVDENLPPVITRAAPWAVSARDASIVLATLAAAALLTFIGVVFSIGLVALQMASQHRSSMVLRGYVRSTTTKVALGTFIATFIYPLAGLGYLEELSRDGRAVSTVSVAVAMVLAIASIAMFIAYVTLTIRGLRLDYAVNTVAIETRAGLRRQFLAEEQYVIAAAPKLAGPGRLVVYRKGPSLALHAAQGVVRAVDVVACVRLARRYNVVLRLVPQIGQHVAGGEPLFEVFSMADSATVEPPDKKLLRCVDVGPEWAVCQVPYCGVGALVDVAVQALSPAVNAPTITVQVLDRLQDFLRLMADRPWPSGLYADESGAVRLITRERSWDQFVDLALTEITESGAGSAQVTRRLVALIDALESIVPVGRRRVLGRHRVLLTEAVALRFGSDSALAKVALEPDARGLG